MTNYKAGDILLLHFPFTNSSGSKQRPGLVLLDAGDGDIVVARITSQSYSTPYDVALSEWSAAGLLFASTVRLHKIITLDGSLVNRPLGQLTEADLASVGVVLPQLFAPFA